MSEVIRKLSRLGAMRPHELAHRVREKLYVELDRIGASVRGGDAPPATPTSFRRYLARMPSARFYSSQRENLRPFFEEHFPQWIDRAIGEADKLCRHELTLLAHAPVQLGVEINWHRDPVTGRIWEQRLWADYRPVHDSGGRDPKIIHELNRHQHLPRLAKAYLLTGEERYASEAVNQLKSWIDQNPPGRGINWQSSLEIAVRAMSWLWTIFALLPSRAFDEASAQRIGDSLFAQLEHVYRYSSLYTSPNTHLIGEAAALYIAGVTFRDLRRPAVWLRHSARTLAETAEKQLFDDGVYGELSTCYHCYALDFYMQAMVLAEQNELDFPVPITRSVRGMLRFLMHLTRPDGTLPSLGDDDCGRALALGRRDYRSFQDGLCMGAILYRRGDLKQQAGSYCEEALWMLGRDGWEVYRQLRAEQSTETRASFPSAGYHVQRSGRGPLDSHMIFDCGGLGILAGAHAHAGALSVTLFSRGRELLVDPGTYVYNCAPEWRSYFRSTRAHNTVTIDDRDQADQGGTFRWNTDCHTSVTTEPSLSAAGYIEAEHDGYQRLPHGVIHRRRLLHLAPESWIVVDDFRGSGEHRFDFHYNFSPDVEVSALKLEESCVLVGANQVGFQLGLFATQPFASAELIRGETAPIEGWASRGYGNKQPCPTLCATLNGPAPAAAMTFFVLSPNSFAKIPDGPHDPVIRRLNVESGRGIACSYEHDGVEDIAILSIGNSEIATAGFRLRGEFCWLRLESGVLKRVMAVRARGLNRDGAVVFQRSEPGPYRAAS